MIPVIHTVCGQQIGWHNGKAWETRQSNRYIRMDGTSPLPFTMVREHCQHCNAMISYPMRTMKLDFERETAHA